MKKNNARRWLGIVLVTALIFVNAPRVFGALVGMAPYADPNSATLQAIYGFNTASGRYAYGYGYGYNYWLSLPSNLQEVEPYSGYGSDPNQTTITVTAGTTVLGGSVASGTVITGPSSGTATIDFATMETGSFSPSAGPFSGNTYSQQVPLGNSTDIVTFKDGADPNVYVEFAAGTTFYSDSATDFTAFQVPSLGSVSLGGYTTSGTYNVDGNNVLTTGGSGSAHIVVDPPATVYYPYSGTVPDVIAFRTTAAWVTAPACTGGSLGATQEICYVRDTANSRIIIYTRVLSQFSGASASGSSTGGGGGGGGIMTQTIAQTQPVLTTQQDHLVATPSGKTFTVKAGVRVRENAFPDVPQGEWYYKYVEVLRKGGIVHGTATGKFEPARNLTRGELVKIALNTFAIEVPDAVSTRPFDDVSVSHWAAPYIEKAKAIGIVSGYADGSFRPDNEINRVEALKILLLASGLNIEGDTMNFSDTVRGAWYTKYVSFAQSLGIVGGYADGSFKPGNAIKRSEMAKIAVETLEEIL